MGTIIMVSPSTSIPKPPTNVKLSPTNSARYTKRVHSHIPSPPFAYSRCLLGAWTINSESDAVGAENVKGSESAAGAGVSAMIAVVVVVGRIGIRRGNGTKLIIRLVGKKNAKGMGGMGSALRCSFL